MNTVTRDCDTCRYHYITLDDAPCSTCVHAQELSDNWKPRVGAKATDTPPCPARALIRYSFVRMPQDTRHDITAETQAMAYARLWESFNPKQQDETEAITCVMETHAPCFD